MKRAFTLFLIALMVLTASVGQAVPKVGSHPCEGDKGGIRAKVIAKSISPGGVMKDPDAIAGLGTYFATGGSGLSTTGSGYTLLLQLASEGETEGGGGAAAQACADCKNPCPQCLGVLTLQIGCPFCQANPAGCADCNFTGVFEVAKVCNFCGSTGKYICPKHI